MINGKEKTGRIAAYDYIRAVAIILVVLCHSVEITYTQSYLELGTASKIFQALFFFLGRLGVPLFLFLTGALILRKKFEDGSDVIGFYKKNLLPLLISSQIFIALYYLFMVCAGTEPFCVTRYFRYALFLDAMGVANMWYIPMIIGVYVCLPFLAMVVHRLDFKTILLPVGLVLAYRFFVPTLSMVSGLLGGNTFGWVIDLNLMGSAYVVYIVLGYYITSRDLFAGVKSNRIVLSAVAGIAAGTAFQIWVSDRFANGAYYRVWYDSPFVLFAAVCIFMLMCRIRCEKGRIFSCASFLSRIAFGIFWIHIIVLNLINPYIQDIGLINPVTVMLLMAVVAVISVAAVVVISLIKPLGRILFIIRRQ